MIDSIFIAESGLRGFQEGLRAISNNTANLNTPGFKASTTQFADMFHGDNTQGSNQYGSGLHTLTPTVNFQPGQLQSTGNALDLALDGPGFFTLKNSNGDIHYSQDGQFKFDSGGTLVSSATGETVMAFDSGGNLAPITLNNLQTNAAQPTTTVTFSGNLSSAATTDTVGNINVIDSGGSSHALSMTLTPVSGSAGTWTATVTDGATTVGTGTVSFNAGQVVPGSGKFQITYAPPAGGAPSTLTFDLSSNVTSTAAGTTSTLAVASQDGFGFGTLSKQTFDATGTLQLTYSNGQVVKSMQLALGQFSSPDDIEAVGNNEYRAVNGKRWVTGVAGSGPFGSVQSGEIEMSNVDLSQEFSNLVIMQRGYQASSQVVSTAGDMLTALFGMMTK